MINILGYIALIGLLIFEITAIAFVLWSLIQEVKDIRKQKK